MGWAGWFLVSSGQAGLQKCWPVPSLVGRVTFSDSDSAPVPKFLNPCPAILQISESDSFSDSGYNNCFNRNLRTFYLRNDHTNSCYCRNTKVIPDPVFHTFLTPGPGPVPKEKCRILLESTPAFRIRSHLCCKNH